MECERECVRGAFTISLAAICNLCRRNSYRWNHSPLSIYPGSQRKRLRRVYCSSRSPNDIPSHPLSPLPVVRLQSGLRLHKVEISSGFSWNFKWFQLKFQLVSVEIPTAVTLEISREKTQWATEFYNNFQKPFVKVKVLGTSTFSFEISEIFVIQVLAMGPGPCCYRSRVIGSLL